MPVLNISTYKFVTLGDREALRVRLQQQCDALALKGTILLAPEGINIFLAGEETAAKVGEAIVCREVDVIRVVGKKKPVRVFELIGDPEKVGRGAPSLGA